MSGSGRIVAVAHFPPPVHGMAVAVDGLITELERRATVRRVSISANGLDRSFLRYHLARGCRVLRGLAVLAAERRRSECAFFSCDAGSGMVYTALLTVVAALLGYRMHLQHHSYAYVDRRSRLLAMVVRLVRSRCVHLVSCPRMRADFLARYPQASTRVVGVARTIEVAERAPRPVDGERLVLGFLGNVSVEKGVDLAIETVRAAERAGLPVELRVAGPVDGPAARVLADAVADPSTSVTEVGPVYGTDRDRFLDGIDVFLFPSLYAHESFGLVAWEAMARGVPILAHRSGCLTTEAVGAAGLVVNRDADFAASALPMLERWWRGPGALARAGDAGRVVAARVLERSERDVEELCADLSGSMAGVAASHGVRRRAWRS